MAVLLAIDCSGDVFSVAVGEGERVVCRRSECGQQSEVALPLVGEALAAFGVGLEGVDGFAFGAGPGKFSALRLACAIAGAFAFAQGRPLIAVPCFAALAYANYGGEGLTVKCAIAAHRRHVYFGVCEGLGGEWEQTAVSVVAVDGRRPRPRIRHACGEGFLRYPDLLGGAAFCSTAVWSDAAAVYQVARGAFVRRRFVDPLVCEPLYVREKVALTVRERRRL